MLRLIDLRVHIGCLSVHVNVNVNVHMRIDVQKSGSRLVSYGALVWLDVQLKLNFSLKN